MENLYAQMKPGDRIIWRCSPGRFILRRWKVEEIPELQKVLAGIGFGSALKQVETRKL